MPHAQHHINLIAKLRVESWFSAHLSPSARRLPDGRSRPALPGLNTSSATVGRHARTSAGAARAAAKIADWMTYLPEDCVRIMVIDGWHYST